MAPAEKDDMSEDEEETSPAMEDFKPPVLYSRPSHFRQTRKKGKILKTVNECYVRDDLGFGTYYTTSTVKKRSDVDNVNGKPQTIQSEEHLLSLLRPCKPYSLVVVDANVLLHNFDVLEQAGTSMPNLVIPQTALMECKSNRMVAYDRTVEVLRSVDDKTCTVFFPDPHHIATAYVDATKYRSPNDVNDERIRQVAAFYGDYLRDTDIQVILLTDDAGSRAIAQTDAEAGYQARSVKSWVQELERHNPEFSLSDLVAQVGTRDLALGQVFSGPSFPAHVETVTLLRGVQTGVYHRGVLRAATQDQQDGATVTIRRGQDRVAVTLPTSVDRNRALDGDVVAIALHPLEEWISSSQVPSRPAQVDKNEVAGIASDTAEPTQSELSNVPETISLEDAAQSLRPTGKVVGIIRRNFASHIGTIFESRRINAKASELSWREQIAAQFEREHPDGTVTCVFFPVDKKVPPTIIRTTQRDRLLGQRIVVSMDSWPADSPYPLGHYVKTIGAVGAKDVETQVLLQQHNIPHEPFPAAVLACLPPEDYAVNETNSPGRLDLRHLPVLSIDPPNCKDIDDALHCILLPNGNHQVGVHIADVSHFCKAGTAMDNEAARRSTSTYLVDRRIDMFPGLLTTDLCSLKSKVDRYAFSILWEVTPAADIVNVDFKKSIIHSVAALTYQQAQSFIDQPESDDIQVTAVKGLAALARKFRKRRIDAGALTLASPEVKFVFDSESLNPTDVQSYALFEANAVVEEFMLLANVTVSKKILRHYPTLSVLRRHPSPNREMFDGLISKAKCCGLEIDIEDSKRLADSLDAAQVSSDPYVNKLLRILSTRCMSPAQYFCSGEFRPTEWHHYGLAAPVYTHFTSPIRRYADVCVHRLLAAALGVAPLPQHMSSKSHMHDLCANMNRRHRSAQLAGRASVQLHTLIFFAGDGAKEESAYVLDVETAESSDPSFTVMVPRYGIEGRVKVPISADDPHLSRHPEEHRLSYKRGGTTVSIKVFDKLKIKIWVREVQDQRELVLDLLEPNFLPTRKLDEVASEQTGRSKRQKAK